MAIAAALLLHTIPAEGLIVGSFNIRYDNSEDTRNGDGWKRRAPVIASLIRFHKFEILGTQECYLHQLKDLQALLPEYAYSGCGRNDGKEAGEYAAIFYRKDLFKMKSEGTFWLSETPESPSISWDAKLKRICSWVQLEENSTKKRLFVFNTHFDHRGKKARAESARMIVKHIREIAGNEAAILTGDFNVDQNSESYRTLSDSTLLNDSYETAAIRYDLNGTPNGFSVNTYSPSRIDHIFHTRGLRPLRYGILTDSYRTPRGSEREITSDAFPGEVKFKNYQARNPSDHFPVLVEFE